MAVAAADFLHAVLQSTYAREWLNQSSVGSTMANLNEGILGRLPIALPDDTAEQTQLTNSLFKQLSEIVEVEILAEECVARLQERRTALISAAVTGKIDVRSKVQQREPAPA
jgi:type I restriction enzyme S subunit